MLGEKNSGKIKLKFQARLMGKWLTSCPAWWCLQYLGWFYSNLHGPTLLNRQSSITACYWIMPLDVVFFPTISEVFMSVFFSCSRFKDYQDTWKSRLCGICSHSHRSRSVLAGRGLASSRQAPHCPPTQVYLVHTHGHTRTQTRTHTHRQYTDLKTWHRCTGIMQRIIRLAVFLWLLRETATLIINNCPFTENGREPNKSAIWSLLSVLYFCCSSQAQTAKTRADWGSLLSTAPHVESWSDSRLPA